tara:strand:- start:3161 stop:4345 length:1185 start_codon:yes stop_codon:yes gene_type:complete
MWHEILKKKPLKKKRAQMRIAGNIVTQELGDYNFAQNFAKWETDCKKASGATIGVTGKRGSNSLLEHMEKHVIPEVMRKNSPNAGKGVTRTIDKLRGLAKGTLVGTDKTKRQLMLLDKGLTRMLTELDLNPANIPFTVPKDFVGGKPVFPDKPNQFGHYRSEMYSKLVQNKNKRKNKDKQQDIKAGANWTSSERDFGARPPMYQAIWADGPLVSVGLHQVVKDAIEALSGASNYVIIQELQNPGKLAELPSVKTKLKELLKTPTIYQTKGGTDTGVRGGKKYKGRIKDNVAANAFGTYKFDVKYAKGDDVKSQEEKYLLEALALSEEEIPAGHFVGFQVKISGRVLIRLLKEAFGDKLANMKNPMGQHLFSDYMDYRPQGQSNVKKSWMMELWA